MKNSANPMLNLKSTGMILIAFLYSSTSEAFCIFNCKPEKTREQCEQENSDLRSQSISEYAQEGVLLSSNGGIAGKVVGAGVGAAAGWVKGWWKSQDCSKYPSAR